MLKGYGSRVSLGVDGTFAKKVLLAAKLDVGLASRSTRSLKKQSNLACKRLSVTRGTVKVYDWTMD